MIRRKWLGLFSFYILNHCLYPVFITRLVLSKGTSLKETTFFRAGSDAVVTCRPQNGAEMDMYRSRSVSECCSCCLRLVTCRMIALSKQQTECLLYDDIVPLDFCLPGEKWYVFRHANCTEIAVITDMTSATIADGLSDTTLFPFLNTTSVLCHNGGLVTSSGTSCQCYGGYVGSRCERLMEDCQEGKTSGYYDLKHNPHLMAWPRLFPQPVELVCAFNGDTIFQKRAHSDNYTIHFSRGWQDYVDGFSGHDGNNFWFGLENLYLLTNSKQYDLCIYLKLMNETFFRIVYRNFRITENETYTATLGHLARVSDDLGDHLHDMDGQPFSAADSDNDNDATRNCAQDYGGGWWFNACAEANFNGQLTGTGNWTGALDEVFWQGLGDTAPTFLSLRLVN